MNQNQWEKNRTKANDDARVVMLLEKWRREDDVEAFAEVFALVYEEISRLAHLLLRRVRRFNVPRTVSLVSSLFLKWVEKRPHSLRDRRDLLRFSNRAMAQVLNEFGRGQQRQQAKYPRVFFSDEAELENVCDPQMEAEPHPALLALESKHPLFYQVFMLKSEGYKQEEMAVRLGVSIPTIKRRFAAAKAFLNMELQ